MHRNALRLKSCKGLARGLVVVKWSASLPPEQCDKKLIVSQGFKKLPKVQKIANSGHSAPEFE